jgi:hypothetical protein
VPDVWEVAGDGDSVVWFWGFAFIVVLRGPVVFLPCSDLRREGVGWDTNLFYPVMILQTIRVCLVFHKAILAVVVWQLTPTRLRPRPANIERIQTYGHIGESRDCVGDHNVVLSMYPVRTPRKHAPTVLWWNPKSTSEMPRGSRLLLENGEALAAGEMNNPTSDSPTEPIKVGRSDVSLPSRPLTIQQSLANRCLCRVPIAMRLLWRALTLPPSCDV